MNKKVLSAILFSALFAGTGTFTSCIDTDEPAGIEELRGAKAELLRAKVTVEQAQASLLLAQAEVEKAKAAKQLADAEISEALAAIAQAKADSINVSNDAQREALKMTIAENQMKLEFLQAKHQTIMNNLNSALAQSQRSYEIMLAQIEIAKAVGSSKEFVTISELELKVRRAQFKVDAALADVEEAQAKYDFAVAYDETHGELNAKKIESMVAAAEDALAEAQADLALWEGYLANAESADWAKEIKALDDSLAVIKKETVELNLAIAKALQSDSLVALKADSAEAAKPATADSVYGHKYFGAEYATTLYLDGEDTKLEATVKATEEAAKKAEINETTLGLIAEYNAKGELVDGQLYDDKKMLASFTTEVKAFLDTIAASVAADSTLEVASKTAIKNWKDALAAYNGLDLTEAAKKTAAETAATAWDSETGKSPKKIDAYRKALLDYLTVAKANGATLNKIPVLQKDSVLVAVSADTYKKVATYALEDALTVLADTVKTFGAIEKFEINFTSATEVKVTDRTEDPDGHDIYGTDGKKLKLTYYKNVIAKVAPVASELLEALKVASEKAFGPANSYVEANGKYAELVNTRHGYLLNQPTEADVKALYTYFDLTDVAGETYVKDENDQYLDEDGNVTLDPTKYVKVYPYGALGAYGKYLYATLEGIDEYAANYKSIMANLETAIAYWEATYKTLNAKYTAWDEAKKAAEDAVENYATNVTKPMQDKIGALTAKAERIEYVQEALRTALAAYLPESFTSQDAVWGATTTLKDDLQAFVKFVNNEIDSAKEAVEEAEHDLADAKLMATLIENGEGIVEKAQADLDEAIANLEAKQAKLDEALANLAKGLEIIAAVNAAE